MQAQAITMQSMKESKQASKKLKLTQALSLTQHMKLWNGIVSFHITPNVIYTSSHMYNARPPTTSLGAQSLLLY
ncbi:hypothetical protein HX040_24090 [Escherichia coli]|nr:hypothetical protein [Escherichia coli]